MAKAVLSACALVLVGLWGAAVSADPATEVKHYVVPGSRAATLSFCVEPTELMRRRHMEFIKHQRVLTVHEGIRGSKYSLAGCVECHISADADHVPVPINRPDQFCGACHAYAAVDLNCFDCHAAVPRAQGTAPLAATVQGRDGPEIAEPSRRDGEGQPR